MNTSTPEKLTASCVRNIFLYFCYLCLSFHNPCCLVSREQRLNYLLTYLLTYSLYGTVYSLKSWQTLSCQTIACFLYEARRFITVLTKTRHWTLSWANRIQFAPSIPISLRSILMLSSYLRLGLPSGLLPSGVTTKTLQTPLPSSMHATCPAHLNHLDLITLTIFGEE
jgi:hypothetical protein